MMLPKISRIVISLLIFISFIGPSMVLAKEGNARKGKYLYRKHCLTCHKAGATGDNVGKPLSPISKTQAEWVEIFKNHKKTRKGRETYRSTSIKVIANYINQIKI